MPILNRAAEMQDEVAGWRRHIHQTPELNFDVFKTAAFVTEKLKEFGCDDVVTGLGKTGVVGIINGRRGKGAWQRHVAAVLRKGGTMKSASKSFRR